LVDPDAGVNDKGPSLHGFQPFRTDSQYVLRSDRKRRSRTILADLEESTNPTET
jgi:hypothetical protein